MTEVGETVGSHNPIVLEERVRRARTRGTCPELQAMSHCWLCGRSVFNTWSSAFCDEAGTFPGPDHLVSTLGSPPRLATCHGHTSTSESIELKLFTSSAEFLQMPRYPGVLERHWPPATAWNCPLTFLYWLKWMNKANWEDSQPHLLSS